MRLLALALVAAVAAMLSGCMSNPADGDLPWNKQQSWEGTPVMPMGMFNQQ